MNLGEMGYRECMSHPLPRPVGPNSQLAISALRRARVGAPALPSDPFDRDTQLAWFMLNEASFAGWSTIDDAAEWYPDVVALRQRFENWFSTLVEQRFGDITDPALAVDQILNGLDGPSMSRHLADHGTRDQVTESLMLRYPYQNKEADPHTFAIPRLAGAEKRALIEIQTGEYGVGHASTHAELFNNALSALTVRSDHTDIIDRLPGIAFATSNLVAMGGLNRALRGVAIGQLALFEMDSVSPNGIMVEACDRLALPAATRRFFDVHVMADAEHQVIARQAFLEHYPTTEPEQAGNVLFGIKAQHEIDVELALTAIGAWTDGRSALCDPTGAELAAS